MDVGSDPVFRRRYTLFHREQYIRGHVQEYGHAQRDAGPVYEPVVSAMGGKTPLEPLCGHNKKQKVVDHHHAGAYVRCNACPSVPSPAD